MCVFLSLCRLICVHTFLCVCLSTCLSVCLCLYVFVFIFPSPSHNMTLIVVRVHNIEMWGPAGISQQGLAGDYDGLSRVLALHFIIQTT